MPQQLFDGDRSNENRSDGPSSSSSSASHPPEEVQFGTLIIKAYSGIKRPPRTRRRTATRGIIQMRPSTGLPPLSPPPPRGLCVLFPASLWCLLCGRLHVNRQIALAFPADASDGRNLRTPSGEFETTRRGGLNVSSSSSHTPTMRR